MEILGIGILAVCFLAAIVVIDAVRSVSRPAVWTLRARTLQEAPAPKVETSAATPAPSAVPATRTASREVQVPVAA